MRRQTNWTDVYIHLSACRREAAAWTRTWDRCSSGNRATKARSGRPDALMGPLLKRESGYESPKRLPGRAHGTAAQAGIGLRRTEAAARTRSWDRCSGANRATKARGGRPDAHAESPPRRESAESSARSGRPDARNTVYPAACPLLTAEARRSRMEEALASLASAPPDRPS